MLSGTAMRHVVGLIPSWLLLLASTTQRAKVSPHGVASDCDCAAGFCTNLASVAAAKEKKGTICENTTTNALPLGLAGLSLLSHVKPMVL